MSINLKKNDSISLVKNQQDSTNQGLDKVFIGLGWDPLKVEKKGFLGGLFSSDSDSGDIDLDASCVLLDSNKNILDTVWFRQLRSNDGSIVHTGDNLTGDGAGDDEVIKVDLSKIPQNVQTLIFVISSFRGQDFSKISSAFCRIVDQNKNQELAKFTLSGKTNDTAFVMAKIFKENGNWTMKALGEGCKGRTVQDFMPLIVKLA